MSYKLKPCPFCGEVNRLAMPGSTDNPDEPEQIRFCVFCLVCNTEGPMGTRDEAAAHWNRRAVAVTAESLLASGWTVDRASLYDEEGVEGWRWTAPDGREYTEIGDWNEPPPLPEIFTVGDKE